MVKVSLEEVLSLCEEDSHLRDYLNTPIKNLPKDVIFSLGREMRRKFKKKTFWDYFNFIREVDPFLDLYFTLFEGKALGWMAFEERVYEKTIVNVRFGSFYYGDSLETKKSNRVFMQDIRRTFEKKIKNEGMEIKFIADKKCPFLKHYYRYIKEAGGGEVVPDGRRYLRISIKVPRREEEPSPKREIYSLGDSLDLLERMSLPIGKEEALSLMRKIYLDGTFDEDIESFEGGEDYRGVIKTCLGKTLEALENMGSLEGYSLWGQGVLEVFKRIYNN